MSSTSLNNKTLEKAQNGDVHAFEKLILAYEKLYYNIAYRMLGNFEDAKDVTQDTLIKIYRNINKCEDIELFKAWSCRILTNTCIDYIRSKKRKYTESLDEEIESDDNSFQKQIDSKTDSPEEAYIKKENKEIIVKAIEELPENYKTVIILRDLNNFSYEEIAKIIDCNLGTVKSRLSRARFALKNILLDRLEQNYNKNV